MTAELMPEWLASTGFLFPTNELELARFEKIYAEEATDLAGFEVDCDQILARNLHAKIVRFEPKTKPENIAALKMVARKGSSLPKHIQDKIKKNQDERNGGANGGPEKGTE
ncbi:hypothetical protein [Mucilaginibacter sp. UR6-11]|uniref:hypothetical protein n=1 Tax=Mucilaginibacter sp. UR6-11 TaxID=1435644 RepID=UPI001E4CA619|nr:hypothetical protein [Mucilaginibacter sp. UR6-11]MCC8423567.1 hypothetical protein [Mucilaginibacter sp. UR6-11]